MQEKFISKNRLEFKYRPFLNLGNGEYTFIFRIGTCNGQFMYDNKNQTIQIINIINDEPHNGHLDDVFECFEGWAKYINYRLYIIEFLNLRFKKHCIDKRGFIGDNNGNIYKDFKVI